MALRECHLEHLILPRATAPMMFLTLQAAAAAVSLLTELRKRPCILFFFPSKPLVVSSHLALLGVTIAPPTDLSSEPS
jgi:hypothetical protein